MTTVHKGYTEDTLHERPEPPAIQIPRRVSSRPCPTGREAIRDAWVAYDNWAGLGEGPYILCPECLNWHVPTAEELA